MKRLLFVFSLLFSLSSFAQDTTVVKKQPQNFVFKSLKEYAGDTISPAGPNEFSFNLSPIFTRLLGSTPDNVATYSLFYKRSLKNPRAVVRAGFLFKPQILAQGQVLEDSLYFNQTDSTRTENLFKSSRKNPIQLNLGMEWRSKGGKRWSTYLALDLMGGAYWQKYAMYIVNQKLDSTGNWQIDQQNTATDKFIDRSAFSWYVGVSPNFGVRYAFNRRWALSLQTGVELYMLFEESYSRNALNTNMKYLNATTFNVDTPALFNEFAITYRF